MYFSSVFCKYLKRYKYLNKKIFFNLHVLLQWKQGQRGSNNLGPYNSDTFLAPFIKGLFIYYVILFWPLLDHPPLFHTIIWLILKYWKLTSIHTLVVFDTTTRMEWNAWSVMSHKSMRHNPIRPQVISQIPPAIPGTYGRMILSVVWVPKIGWQRWYPFLTVSWQFPRLGLP